MKVNGKQTARIVRMLPSLLFFLVVITIVCWSWQVVIPCLSYVAAYIKNPGGAAPNNGWPRWFLGLPVWYWYFFLFPLVYWLFFLASCTPLVRGAKLVAAGVFFHACLLVWAVIAERKTAWSAAAAVASLFSLSWVVLCAMKLRYARPAAEHALGADSPVRFH
jgi:hypothetical protein